MQESYRLAHSLAGSSTTFGFVDLSAYARKLEIELKALLHDKAEDAAATRDRIPGLSNLLLEAVQAAGSARVKPEVVPLPEVESALPVLEQLRESFENIRQTFGMTEFCGSFSYGVTAYSDHQTAEDILHHADVALYKAKHQGRNRLVIAD